jgi:hypothetical protein
LENPVSLSNQHEMAQVHHRCNHRSDGGSGLGLVIALLVMSFESQEASRSPGDGFLIGLCVFTGFAIGLMWAANYFNDSRNQDAGTDR